MSVIRLLLLVLLIAAGGKAAALTLYVSPAGHDRNAGTRDQPLASLKGAQHKVRQWRKQNHRQEAVEIRILEGDYFMQEPLTLLPEDEKLRESK